MYNQIIAARKSLVSASMGRSPQLSIFVINRCENQAIQWATDSNRVIVN